MDQKGFKITQDSIKRNQKIKNEAKRVGFGRYWA
jgi:hypothetical protein